MSIAGLLRTFITSLLRTLFRTLIACLLRALFGALVAGLLRGLPIARACLFRARALFRTCSLVALGGGVAFLTEVTGALLAKVSNAPNFQGPLSGGCHGERFARQWWAMRTPKRPAITPNPVQAAATA